jgi:rubrerythrin
MTNDQMQIIDNQRDAYEERTRRERYEVEEENDEAGKERNMCEECGVEIKVGIDGVCPICNKTLCYDCFVKNHRSSCALFRTNK